MRPLFLLKGAERRHPDVQAWFVADAPLVRLARQAFDLFPPLGDDVLQVMHDGQPTLCVGDAAFAYVAAFTAHVNVGFFHGAALDDPLDLLEGSGRFMRHVKLRQGGVVPPEALSALARAAYTDVRARIAASD